METNEPNSKFLPVAVVVAGLLIAGAVMWNGSHPAAGPAGSGDAPKVNIKDVKTNGNPFIGRADAPVMIAFWSDFQCPYCKNFELGTLPQIVKEYVDTGKVKVVFMDFTFLGSDSTDAALYSRSVWKLYPDAYFAWRTAMYTAQDDEGDKGFGDAASIDKLDATVAGIDVAKVAADVKANTSVYQASINSNKVEGQKVGLNATPSFVIGTKTILGAYPYATFKTAIDEVFK
ncbi:MAG: thioredoxin domain-containing protein [Candidatus Kaiserbacteria bacterium]|nr:thioredoxin domain-containing protein [Candidatus Kaiserbacteria bacterium]